MELQYDPAGRTLLKTAATLMIVFGAVGILIYLLGLAAVIGISYATSGVFSASRDLFGMSLLLAGAIVELIAGILGVKAAKRPARAGKALLVWGALCLLLTLAGMGHIALRAADSAPLWELILGRTIATQKYREQNNSEHLRIAQAVLDRHVDDAYVFMKDHMEQLYERYWSES